MSDSFSSYSLPLEAQVELLQHFLTQREAVVERIESLISAQRNPSSHNLTRPLEDCFFARNTVTPSQAQLRGQLEIAYCAQGFQPRQVQHIFNDLIHPAEMLARSVYCWQQTRWPGRSGRMHYAHTLFNIYILRSLQFLSLRLWDDDASRASNRLGDIRRVLDELWRSSPANQPAFVRDARWLIPLAQSLITDELAPYFDVAQQITDTLPETDVLEIQKAHVRMLGGHLTSQVRHYCTRDSLSINDPSVLVRTRSSNALDLALLIQGLVWLLRAYDRAIQSGDAQKRLDMAGAIFQGISPDPELFLNRVVLLSAYSMVEHVFTATDASAHIAYSPEGQRHVSLVQEYAALIDRLIPSLRQDIPQFKPVEGSFSTYGVLFGLPSTLVEHMALKAVQHDAETRFSLEDVFNDDRSPAKLAWINGWRDLPHIPREVQQAFAYPQQFATEIYDRIGQQLQRQGAPTTGRLHIGEQDECPQVPARYLVSSDKQLVATHQAEFCEQAQLLRDRQEAHFLVSYKTDGGWVGLKKSLLAEIIGTGQDACIANLPPDAVQVLRLTCAGLV